MNANLYIFRHGITDWNQQEKMQGHTDIPLNEEGRNQANELAKKFKHQKLDLILCSDLSRARETALIALEEKRLRTIHSKEIRELELGHCEGKYRSDIIKEIGEDQWQRYLDTKEMQFSFPGGEKKIDCLTRLKIKIEQTIETEKCKNLAISTHGGCLHLLIHNSTNPPKPNPIPNCALFKIEIKNKIWHYITQL